MSLSPASPAESRPSHSAAPAPAGLLAELDGFFARSREKLESVVDWLGGGVAAEMDHAGLEERLRADGREMSRLLLQDHLDLRACREQRLEQVTGADGVPRRSAEPDHRRPLATVVGEVRVARMAYRARGQASLHPADAALNLPPGKHSHGQQRLAAHEAARGSFDQAAGAIRHATGVPVGKRQAEELAQAAAADFGSFYATTRPPAGAAAGDVLVLSADGSGIVMRPGALRPKTRKAAAQSRAKLATRLTRGEVRHRKRMAEVGAVYNIAPVPRTPADIITLPGDGPAAPKTPGPAAHGKWLTASITTSASQVIAAVFDEAERRDPRHARTWIALVDGNCDQIRRITAEARRRGIEITILIDFIHVYEHLWDAAWCFHPEADPAAETWAAAQARAILGGRAADVAAAIRRTPALTPAKRKTADTAARYLDNKQPHLDYPRALAAGWPIATGIIEGACRHLVKDRMCIGGARWGLPGAEAILQLRALLANGDFDRYWAYHLAQEHHRNHQTRYLNGAVPRAA